MADAPGPTPMLEYDGHLGALYRMFLLNILLTILTLGIWRFWAITRYRRYLWSRMRFQGERFTYTGTGGELFLGLLLAIAIVAAIGIACSGIGYVLYVIAPKLRFLAFIPFYLAIVILALGAPFSAQRYRLSRTLWCNTRGGMTGSMFAYGLRALLYVLLIFPTLYQIIPWITLRLAERRINASIFGATRFHFTGRAWHIYPAFLATIALWLISIAAIATLVFLGSQPAINALITLLGDGIDASTATLILRYIGSWIIVGLAAFILISTILASWYNAVVARHIFGNTTLGPLTFASRITGPRLFILLTGNLLIILCTLGLGWPITIQRDARFLARNTLATGAITPELLGPSTLPAPRTGEGMLSLLDGGSAL